MYRTMYLTGKIALRRLGSFSRAMFGTIELLIAMRVILVFSHASQSTPFVMWLYRITEPLLRPFTGIFPSFDIGKFVVETYAIFALFIYAFAGFLVSEILHAISRRHAPRYKRPRV